LHPPKNIRIPFSISTTSPARENRGEGPCPFVAASVHTPVSEVPPPHKVWVFQVLSFRVAGFAKSVSAMGGHGEKGKRTNIENMKIIKKLAIVCESTKHKQVPG
jgi:hypothetical protein